MRTYYASDKKRREEAKRKQKEEKRNRKKLNKVGSAQTSEVDKSTDAVAAVPSTSGNSETGQ